MTFAAVDVQTKSLALDSLNSIIKPVSVDVDWTMPSVALEGPSTKLPAIVFVNYLTKIANLRRFSTKKAVRVRARIEHLVRGIITGVMIHAVVFAMFGALDLSKLIRIHANVSAIRQKLARILRSSIQTLAGKIEGWKARI